MKPPTLKDRLEYVGVVAFVKAIRLLPNRVAVRIGGLLGRLAFDLVRKRRRVTLANIRAHLAQAGKGPSPAAIGRPCKGGDGGGHRQAPSDCIMLSRTMGLIATTFREVR